jgi:hypothetical protein
MFLRRIALVSSLAALAACASAPHDTLAFKGVVYSLDTQAASTQTTAVPIPGAGIVPIVRSSGGFTTYLLRLEDGTTYAVRSFNRYVVGDCVAVYMSSERAQSGGYLNVKETTIVSSSGCKAEVK